MWSEPKTNWQKGDIFSLETDYTRIKDNISHLYAMAKKLYSPFELTEMKFYSHADYIYADFFNAIDGNVEKLLNNTFKRKNQEPSKQWLENGYIFNADDLNRIESAILRLYGDLQSAAQNRPTIKFKLGGGIFGTAI